MSENERYRYRKLDLPGGKTAELWLEIEAPHVKMHRKRPNGEGTRAWKKCAEPDCLGEIVEPFGKCLGHVGPQEQEEHARRVALRQEVLSMNGVDVSRELLRRILPALAGSSDKHVTATIQMEGAQIHGGGEFHGLVFEREFNIAGATLLESLAFDGCTFLKGFFGAYIQPDKGALDLKNCIISGRDADFSYSHSELNGIRVDGCKFEKSITVVGSTSKALRFENSIIAGDLTITDSKPVFIILAGSTIEGELIIRDTECATLRAKNLRSNGLIHVGPIKAQNDCDFVQATFEKRAVLEIDAAIIDLTNAIANQGGQVDVARATVKVAQLSAGRPLRISGVSLNGALPRIPELRGTDASSLVLSHVDLSDCAFYGAHGLGGIAIERSVKFARHSSRHGKRRYVADELFLPGAKNKAAVASSLRPAQVASVYRDLRRSFEAASDEPGGADFYYGEMEMRRRDKDAGVVDRLIVWLYWLVSGYGLRELRPLFWLLALVSAASIVAGCFASIDGPINAMDSFLFSLRSMVPGLRPPPHELTQTGILLEVALAILGPLLFALFILAVRNRVKRR